MHRSQPCGGLLAGEVGAWRPVTAVKNGVGSTGPRGVAPHPSGRALGARRQQVLPLGPLWAPILTLPGHCVSSSCSHTRPLNYEDVRAGGERGSRNSTKLWAELSFFMS